MLLDSSAWVEFFQGSEKGKEVRLVLEREESFTSLVTFSEIAQWCLRTGRKDLMICIEAVKRMSRILVPTEVISIVAGKMNYERKKAGKKWGMMDSIIVATAQVYGLKVLTKDNGFRDLAEAQIL